MKKVLKIVLGIVICLYLVIAAISTGFLLKRNEYNVTKFFDYSLFIVDDDSLGEEYPKESLLAIKDVANEDISIGDYVFYYDTYSTDKVIRFDKVTKKENITDAETTYTIRDNNLVSSQYIIGTKESTSTFTFLGKVMNVLQSKWGFLFIIVFPIFLAFIYELYAIVKEIKNK